MLALAESAEFKAGFADRLEIARLYYLLQQRMPTAAELLVWQDFLQGGDPTGNLTASQANPDNWTSDLTTLTDQFRESFLDDLKSAN